MFDFEKQLTFDAKQLDLITVGEMLVDMIADDYGALEKNAAFHRFFGGSPANIAANTRRLGIQSLVVSSVGNDGFGQFLLEHLTSIGAETSYVQQVPASTSLVVVSKSTSSPVPIFYRGADYQLAYTDKLKEAVRQAKIVHLSSWPLSKQPARSVVEEVMHEARQHGALVCFDPNYHPALWEADEDGIGYLKSILPLIDIVKPSEDDAERFFGKDTNENYIRHFLSLGVKLVILTLGKDGALISNGRETLKLDTLATEVIDTTGAGDAFWSGFYAAIVKGYSVRKALESGSAVSAFKLKHMGAVAELPMLEVLHEQYRI